MGRILEACFKIDFREWIFPTFKKFTSVFKSLVQNPLMGSLFEDFNEFSFESGKTTAGKMSELFDTHIAKKIIFHKNAQI